MVICQGRSPSTGDVHATVCLQSSYNRHIVQTQITVLVDVQVEPSECQECSYYAEEISNEARAELQW